MSREIEKSNHGAQPLKCLNKESVDDLLASVNQFIEGVYRDLSIIKPNRGTSKNSNRLQVWRSLDDSCTSNDSPTKITSTTGLSSGDENRNAVSPSTRVNMDAEIERINRMCDTVDKNLRSIGVFMNNSGDKRSSDDLITTNTTSSPVSSTNLMSDLSLENSTSVAEPIVTTTSAEIIDLSDIQSQTILDNEDDVIIVSANINPVVDLCTPGDSEKTRQRRYSRHDHSCLRKRRLTMPDVEIVGTSNLEERSTVGKRRSENKEKSFDISIPDAEINKNASGHIPYMCSVCMESCLQRKPTSTRCGHIFCHDCVTQAIRITHKCPLCNTRISKTSIFRIYP